MKYSRLFLATVIPVALLFLFISTLQTKASPNATFNVNSTLDAVDANPGDGVCETAVGNGVCTMRAAVMEANVTPSQDTIYIPSGTYPLTIDGRSEDLGATGDIDIIYNVIISGAGYQATFLDGNSIDRLFHITGNVSPNVTIGNLTIQNGAALRSNYDYGGAVFNETGIVTIENSRITKTSDEGIRNSNIMTITNSIIDENTGLQTGGIHNVLDGSLTIIESVIANNSGGIYNETGALIITASSITKNQESGGIYQSGPNNSPIMISNSEISENYNVDPGGGIGVYNGHEIIIKNTIINNNTSSIAGGIHFYGTVMTISNTTIDNNLAIGGGGSQGAGIQMIGGKLILTNSSVTNNRLFPAENTKGGGIYLEGGAVIENSTISQNVAGTGGGLFLAGGSSIITNTTIVNNEATMGGGIYDQPNFFSPAFLYNSIVAKNTDENCSGGSDGFGLEITSLGNNLESENSCEFASSGDLINTDPLLGSLTWNGGFGLTHTPLAGSPAIDAGNNTNCSETDQRGATRPYDGDGDETAVCDIGAVEYGALPFTYIYLPLVMKP